MMLVLDGGCLANAASELKRGVRLAQNLHLPGRVPASFGHDQKLPSASDQRLAAGGWWTTAHRTDSPPSTWGARPSRACWPQATFLPQTIGLRKLE